MLPIVTGVSVVLIASVFTALAVVNDDSKDKSMDGALYEHREWYGGDGTAGTVEKEDLATRQASSTEL